MQDSFSEIWFLSWADNDFTASNLHGAPVQTMQVIRTRGGVRLKQHGVVISEVRVTPGPTHSIFDVLAALMVALDNGDSVGLLGFSAGGMLAPLVALGWQRRLVAVDLDAEAYEVFCRECPQWIPRVTFHQAEASTWLRRCRSRFGFLVEDLSVATPADVVKPDVSWTELPALIRRRLLPGGTAVFNLLPDPVIPWTKAIPMIRRHFRDARQIHLEEFENRLLVVGERLPDARRLGRAVDGLLASLGSRQAGLTRARIA